MFNIPTIMTADELIDKAFKRASRVNVTGRSKIDMIRKKNIAKISSSADVISSALKKYVEAFPTIDDLPPFYLEIIYLLIGVDRLKKSLGAIDWCSKRVMQISRPYVKKMKRNRNIDEIDALRTEFYGRASSLVRQVDKDLRFLGEARDQMRRMPTIDPSIETVVVAGAPNVGKSQLVTAISTAAPKIAIYPFTTQEITVGIFTMNRNRFQIIDTPGLLDRPLEKRNDIERRSILALRHLANLVIFMLDPTGTCGYPIDYQLSLLDGIRKQLPEMKMIVIDNKGDIAENSGDRLSVSALTGLGLEELKRDIGIALSD